MAGPTRDECSRQRCAEPDERSVDHHEHRSEGADQLPVHRTRSSADQDRSKEPHGATPAREYPAYETTQEEWQYLFH
jgi:hypothetical protein